MLCLNRGVLCLELMPAHLAELVDALGLGSSGFGRGGSSPPVGIENGAAPLAGHPYWGSAVGLLRG